ncbi:glycosyltransferase family 4 protein [Algoriphagus aquatilis]|uniref:Glycosyltransferase family 4 protein n=1 Tax=Algoriphagus aquatilis TaxID=490186 RepID=A0ABW0BYW5_9BACT
MKVLFFVRDIKAASVTFIRTQIKLVQSLHEVLVITIDHQHSYVFDSISCVGIPFQYSYWTNRPLRRLAEWDWYYGFFNPLFGKKLLKEIREFGPDVIHCQFGTDATIFLDHFANPTKIPVFIQFRGYDASHMYGKKSYLSRLKQFFARPWIHPIYVSLNQYERTLELNLQPDKRRILYSCTDTDLFTFSPRINSPEKGEFKFLQVGRMVEVKGHEFTLLAFRQAVSFLESVGKKASLTFVGEGPLLRFLQEKSRELGLEEQVYFTPSVPHAEVRGFLLETDFFLHPSVTTGDGRIEGLPNAIMEALAVGVPVIATKHSGIEELMCPDGALFLVEEWNVAEYADTMIRLVEGKLVYNLLQSRRMIEEKFSTKQHIAKLLDFYEEELT